MAESCPEDSVVPETVTNKLSEQSETNKIICEDSKNNEDRSKEKKICEGDNQELIEDENQEVCKNIERNDEEFPVNEEDNQNLAKEIIPKGSHMICEYFNENSSDNVAEDICSNTEISKTVKKSCSTEKLPDGNDEINSREDITKNSLPHQNEVNADEENKKDEKQPTHLCSIKSLPLIDLTIVFPQACENPPQAGPSGIKPRFESTILDDELVSLGRIITLSSDSETEENENSISLKRKFNEEDNHNEKQKKMHYVVDPETKISYNFPIIAENCYTVIDIISDSEIEDCENSSQKENQNAENELEILVNNVNDNSNELSIETLDDSTKELDESNIEEQFCEDPSQEENDKNAEKENDGANDEHCDSKELDYEDVNN